MSLDRREIPRRPGNTLYARADVVRAIANHPVSAWVDAAYQGESFLDAANLARVPARVLIGGGVRLPIAAGFAVSGTVANALDTRVVDLPLDPPPSPELSVAPTALTDVAGFPLPGRSFYLTVDWTR
jgi:outer membrane receptor protein involved in Fe transport